MATSRFLMGVCAAGTVLALSNLEAFRTVELKTYDWRLARTAMANPSVLDRVTSAAAARREEFERHRETRSPVASPLEIRRSLLERVRHFLRL